MKKIIGIIGGIVFSLTLSSVKAQQTWDAKKNPTVDSITTPFESKLLPSRTAITTLDIFPVIGTFESSTNSDAPLVAINLDEQVKGFVWVDGLPQGRIKAMLRKSPATYKIPAQKTEDGKNVPEGTLIYDKDVNILSIKIGKPYNAENPAAAFIMTDEEASTVNKQDIAKTTKKSGKTVKPKAEEPKPWTYTGTKIEKTTASNQ